MNVGTDSTVIAGGNKTLSPRRPTRRFRPKSQTAWRGNGPKLTKVVFFHQPDTDFRVRPRIAAPCAKRMTHTLATRFITYDQI